MKRRTFLQLSALTPLALGANRVFAATGGPGRPASMEGPDGRARHFGFARQQFVLDGKPLQIRSGQMDPIRIPRPYWRQRIRMVKAMGLNTIAIYLMWNAMESEPGQFDLTTDRRDFVHFIELCADEGMWVFLRPGPYVCGEWDFGGLPTWLLRDPDVKVRHADDKHYMQAVTRYFDTIAPRIRPLMASQGGPVLMLQIENEYASFGKDLGYLETLQRMWRERGIDGPFAVADGFDQIRESGTYVPGAALGLDAHKVPDFAAARKIAGEAPVWISEGYTGWLSHWGDKGFQKDVYASTLRKLVDANRSFNLYEVHGGTNFGFGAGSNASDDGGHFLADLTSYDYGAPITEQGAATDDYHHFRAIIADALGTTLPPVPDAPPVETFDPVKAMPWTSVWDHLPKPAHSHYPHANEILFGQGQGMVMYRIDVDVDRDTPLEINGVHDYATVFADGKYVGTISRQQGDGLPAGNTFKLSASGGKAMRLEILIDSFGHVNFGHCIRDEKGLVGDVLLDGIPLAGWQVFSLPLNDAYVSGLKSSSQPAKRPGVFFRAQVTRHDGNADSYIDMSEWNKGYVWVNGHLLGRYWHIGPQQRLFCPAEWWHEGANEVVIFDQHRTRAASIRGMRTLHDDMV